MWQFVALSLLDLLAFALLGLIPGAIGVFVMPGCSVPSPSGRARQLRGVVLTVVIATAGSLLAGLATLYWWPSAEGHTQPIGFAAAFFGALIALGIRATWSRSCAPRRDGVVKR